MTAHVKRVARIYGFSFACGVFIIGLQMLHHFEWWQVLALLIGGGLFAFRLHNARIADPARGVTAQGAPGSRS